MSLVRCTDSPVADSSERGMQEEPGFRHCECYDIGDVNVTARKNMLADQLLHIHRIFDKFGIVHLLAYGTAIGAIRDNDINDLENDNDLYVPSNFEVTPQLRSTLHRVGLLIFQDNIFRVCKLSSHGTKNGHNDEVPEPFDPEKMQRKVCPYSDLYPTNIDTMRSSGSFVDWESGKAHALPSPLSLDSILIKSARFKMLPRAVTYKILEEEYGKNWMVHPMRSNNVGQDTSAPLSAMERTKRSVFDRIKSN